MTEIFPLQKWNNLSYEILTLFWWLLRLQKVIQLLWTMLDVWMSFPEKSLAKCQFIWQNIHDGRHIFRHFSADFLHYFSLFGQGSFSIIVWDCLHFIQKAKKLSLDHKLTWKSRTFETNMTAVKFSTFLRLFLHCFFHFWHGSFP